jgi:hypothetical protein
MWHPKRCNEHYKQENRSTRENTANQSSVQNGTGPNKNGNETQTSHAEKEKTTKNEHKRRHGQSQYKTEKHTVVGRNDEWRPRNDEVRRPMPPTNETRLTARR